MTTKSSRPHTQVTPSITAELANGAPDTTTAPADPGYHPQPGGSYLLQPDGTPAATPPATTATTATPTESE